MTSDASFLQKRNKAYLLRKMGRGTEAWLYAVSLLGVMAVRTMAAPLKGESLRDHARFWRRLLHAYVQLLLFDRMVQ